MNRREFLERASAAACVAVHGGLAWGARATEPRGEASKAGARILGLRLATHRPLAELKTFYGEKLGLPILAESKDSFTLAGGSTPITFVTAGADQGQPFYHFAFNVPENKIRGAHDWQRERTALDKLSDDLRDPEMPQDVVHFRHWNAHSVFFWDPAGNLVEYIARHDLQNAAPGGFTQRDILHASEIGFIADDVTATAEGMKRALGVEQYRNGDDDFRALGDEHGLLLVIRRGRRWGYDKAAARPTTVFPTIAEIRGARPTRYAVPGFPYEIGVR